MDIFDSIPLFFFIEPLLFAVSPKKVVEASDAAVK